MEFQFGAICSPGWPLSCSCPRRRACGAGAGDGGALLQEPAGAEEGKEEGSAGRSVQGDVKALSAAHFNTGVTLFDLADWPAAVTHLRHARALEPEALDARFNAMPSLKLRRGR